MMKKVRFQDDCLITHVCEVMNRRQLTQLEIRKLWYSTDDFKYMKASCKVLSRQVQRYGRSHLLNGSTQISKDCTMTDNTQHDSSLQNLILWANYAQSCRGLEKWVNKNEGRMRKNLQRDSIEQVLKFQEQQYHTLPSDDLAATAVVTVDEKLKAISESCTHAAKTFARNMAIADAMAVSSFLHHEDGKKDIYPILLSKLKSRKLMYGTPCFKVLHSNRIP
jgi:hypothetical protein